METFAAAGFPTLTPVAVRAVTRKAPHIPQGEDGGLPLRQLRQGKVIEISRVNIVEIDNIRFFVKGMPTEGERGSDVQIVQAETVRQRKEEIVPASACAVLRQRENHLLRRGRRAAGS